jgi:2-dehydro-3-deoxyphosphogluconate aldolase/(4S)-4-hydroxy-2-oxoglutarate aldolase
VEKLTLPSPDGILPACRVVPVVVVQALSETAPLLSALADGNVPCAEITFRTPCAAQALRLAVKEFPSLCVGAGTVINGEQARLAVDCGAAFLVSPGLSPDIAKVCAAAGVPYLPGCVTPTEIMVALELGITTVKFFPAQVYGGLEAIKALGAPFPQVRFLPTGGVDLSNIRPFLDCDRVAAVGGSFLLKGDIRANCRRLHDIIG